MAPGRVSVPATVRSPQAKLVYLYLRVTGGGSVEDVCAALGLKLVTAYPVLASLVREGLVAREGETFRCV